MKNKLENIIVLIIVAIILSGANISIAVTQSEINNQRNQQSQINNQIDEAERKHEELEAQKSATMKQVESIGTQIQNYESQIDELESQISDANAKIQEAETRLEENQKEYEKEEEMFKQRMVAIYEAGDTSYLDFLLSSKSLTDFISNYYLVSELAQMDVDLMERIEKQKDEIEASKKTIEENKQTLTTAKASKESVATQLKSSKAEKDAYVAKLSDEEKKVESEIQELKVANQRIANEIKEAERKYAEQLKALQNSSSSSAPSASGGYLSRPISGGTITCQGYYSSGKFHGAIDYAVSVGTPVYAAADGVVMSTANLTTSYGTYVVIRHANGLQTYYCHGTRGSIRVKPGQTVSRGTQIMLSGNTGNSTGPHLHFEVRKSPYNYNGYATGYGQDSRVNPLSYM